MMASFEMRIESVPEEFSEAVTTDNRDSYGSAEEHRQRARPGDLVKG
jgi:hypothetical protein